MWWFWAIHLIIVFVIALRRCYRSAAQSPFPASKFCPSFACTLRWRTTRPSTAPCARASPPCCTTRTWYLLFAVLIVARCWLFARFKLLPLARLPAACVLASAVLARSFSTQLFRLLLRLLVTGGHGSGAAQSDGYAAHARRSVNQSVLRPVASCILRYLCCVLSSSTLGFGLAV